MVDEEVAVLAVVVPVGAEELATGAHVVVPAAVAEEGAEAVVVAMEEVVAAAAVVVDRATVIAVEQLP